MSEYKPILIDGKIIVERCSDEMSKRGSCPFNYDTNQCWATTKVPDGGFGIRTRTPNMDICPLKNGPIIVELKK